VSVQDQKINALAQLVAILMEKQKLAEPEHRPEATAEQKRRVNGRDSISGAVSPSR
jgi:hypothetical protein